jgi:hypothetical protein
MSITARATQTRIAGFDLGSHFSGGNNMLNKTLVLTTAIAALISVPCFAGEGKFDHQTCYVGPVHIIHIGEGTGPGGDQIGSYEFMGHTPAKDGDPLTGLSTQCNGAFSVVKGQLQETGGCHSWDAAGDNFYGIYSRSGDAAKAVGTWHVVKGTGKFVGLTVDGNFTVQDAPPAPNMINGCTHDWGTYSLK